MGTRKDILKKLLLMSAVMVPMGAIISVTITLVSLFVRTESGIASYVISYNYDLSPWISIGWAKPVTILIGALILLMKPLTLSLIYFAAYRSLTSTAKNPNFLIKILKIMAILLIAGAFLSGFINFTLSMQNIPNYVGQFYREIIASIPDYFIEIGIASLAYYMSIILQKESSQEISND